MKTTFNFIMTLALLAATVAHAESSDVQKLAALADYVAADYPGAVKNGAIVTPSEYEEQRGLVAEARHLAATLPARPQSAQLDAALAKVSADLDRRASEADVSADCRAVHQILTSSYGLVLAPSTTPSRARAVELYAVACTSCHGQTGAADTDVARTLKPAPPSFLDGERMARVSPSLAFHALTFGTEGTAMASFESLPAADRWSLAFLVVGLRHRGDDARGEKLATATGPWTAQRLAELNDGDLAALLATPNETDRRDAISYLRHTAPFVAPRATDGDFAEARRQLNALKAALAGGPAGLDRARALGISAYLEGIEPHEDKLRATAPELSSTIEADFEALRHALDHGDVASAQTTLARLFVLLDRADSLGEGGASVAFFAALTIALREGFEISLLVAALLAFVRKSGHADKARWVHVGWLAAIPVGVVTWFVVGAALAGAQRELTEGILTLFAATMLLFVSHFVLGKLESQHWLKFLKERTVDAAGRPSEARVPWALVAVAFVAAYREAIEIVLFFRALAMGQAGRSMAVVAGAAVGTLVLVTLVTVMSRLGRRLNPRPVLVASGILLTALAVSLVGQGLHALQEGGYLRITPLGGPRVPTLGWFATVEGLVAQLIVIALVIIPLWRERQKERASSSQPRLA